MRGRVSFRNRDNVRTFPVGRRRTGLNRKIEDTREGRCNGVSGRYKEARGDAIRTSGSVIR